MDMYQSDSSSVEDVFTRVAEILRNYPDLLIRFAHYCPTKSSSRYDNPKIPGQKFDRYAPIHLETPIILPDERAKRPISSNIIADDYGDSSDNQNPLPSLEEIIPDYRPAHW